MMVMWAREREAGVLIQDNLYRLPALCAFNNICQDHKGANPPAWEFQEIILVVLVQVCQGACMQMFTLALCVTGEGSKRQSCSSRERALHMP